MREQIIAHQKCDFGDVHSIAVARLRVFTQPRPEATSVRGRRRKCWPNVREGFVSAEAAQRDYGVMLTADGNAVDEAATEKRRVAKL